MKELGPMLLQPEAFSELTMGNTALVRAMLEAGVGVVTSYPGSPTPEIAEAIQTVLKPQGVGVVIEAEHSCMTLRGVNAPGASLSTSHLIGVVRDDPRTREEFLRLVRG